MRHSLIYLIAASVSACAVADPAGEEFFEKRVRPIFAEQCGKCHGAQAEKIKGGLRLDSRAAILKGGDTAAAVVPGEPDKSLLITALRYTDKDLQMPPPAKDGTERKLAESQIADLTEWVKMGAPIPQAFVSAGDPSKHWAFQTVARPPLPDVQDKTWPKTEVDAFFLARLEAANLVPASPADPRTLLRRMTYDLTGLPPTPEEVDAFVANAGADRKAAIDHVLTRLLASPAYGERWGRKWLDVVRYADSAGDNSDYPSPQAWRYRNYVIEAFNRDMPYDQFVREQLAGDLLASTQPRERYAECITATGYLAVARRFGGGKEDPDFYLTIEDTIDTLGKSVLGLTIGCARCHNHKYDPITSRDFYGLYGIFASTRYAFPGNEEAKRSRDLVPLVPPAEIQATLKPWETEIARLDGDRKRLEGEIAENRKASVASASAAIAEGDIPNGGAQEVAETTVQMKTGEMLQLTILPKANHGADSTQLELEITEAGGTRSWSLSREAVEHFAEEAGGSRFGAWSLLDATTPTPALFTRLERNVVNTPGLHHWQGAEDFPVVTANTNANSIKIINAIFAPHSLVVHPAPAGNVAVAWECPVDGAFVAKGRVIDIDPGGGDGVAWKLEQRPGIGAALTDLLAQTRALAVVKKQRDEFAAKRPPVEMAYAVTEGKIANARIQKRGEPKDLGDEVPRKNIDLLGGQLVPPDGGSGRAQLAAWLTDVKNPLTARVMVNRIWLGHFGRGLVATPNDFGTRGALPTHPELLDWLATKFVESGWSVKAMHRLIMSSAAYQQAGQYSPSDRQPATVLAAATTPGSAVPVAAAERAPQSAENLSVFPRRRLDAEEIRDTLLALSDDLDRNPGAGHPFPDENTWGFTQHNPFKAVYDSRKRSVYLMAQRIQRHPYLALFDGADTNASTPARGASTVPTQALWFLNNPFIHARADSFAKRLLAESDDAGRLTLAFRLCFQRAPTDAESQSASAFLAAYQTELTDLPADLRPLAAWSAYARVLLSSNELLHLD